jgi:hypothetical protein
VENLPVLVVLGLETPTNRILSAISEPALHCRGISDFVIAFESSTATMLLGIA